ncbi:hypothetical protein [Mesorhizobium australafricanum]|uniref:Restriction endonuclease n=1 Tax=Mesorhizobium australafricanum TaxID=3072311 RepID=A0ABU4X0L7_9HYPH|nr:hypothetical protein [Mesorhizobium sp. VK3E]MDX8440619.1 hypothetical protein [Mesorhizobium sp. VK3E]
MSFTFLPKEMSDDLVSLSRVAAPFFSGQSVSRIERLAKDLINAVANAKATGDTEFNWKTAPSHPIQIKESRQWKGGTEDFDPLSADISIDYKCTLIDASERTLAKGVTVIRIKDSDKATDKVFHFDVENGGWTEMHKGKERARAGHPAFHMQFYGMVNDIPRIPSLIIHPVDVLSWAILELHQKKWREHVMSANGKSQLRLIPGRQRSRFDQILTGWRQMINKPDHLAIVAMQSPISEPLAL